MISEDTLKNIEKLHEMKGAGILSEAEFEEAKQRLLAGERPVAARLRSVDAVPPIERPADGDNVAWALLPLKRYAEFNGRSGRREFWVFSAAVTFLQVSLLIIWSADTQYGETGPIGNLAVLTFILGIVGLAVPYVALQVRRFHDQGKSGLFALLNLIPYVGALAVLGFMLVEGTRGENEYGPDPSS